MPYIDTIVVCHRLNVNLYVRPVSQRKKKFSEEKRVDIDKEVSKLESTNFVTQVKYPT